MTSRPNLGKAEARQRGDRCTKCRENRPTASPLAPSTPDPTTRKRLSQSLRGQRQPQPAASIRCHSYHSQIVKDQIGWPDRNRTGSAPPPHFAKRPSSPEAAPLKGEQRSNSHH